MEEKNYIIDDNKTDDVNDVTDSSVQDPSDFLKVTNNEKTNDIKRKKKRRNRKKNKRTNRWEGDCYVYCGGPVNEDDKQRIVHVQIDKSVIKIENCAFEKCTHLTTVSFVSENCIVEEIGNRSFFGCSNLESIDLRLTCIKLIGNYAFHCCSNLTTVNFSTQIQGLGRFAFSQCSRLITIKLPQSIERMASSCFEYCTALTTVDLLDCNVRALLTRTFAGCSNLTTVKLPKCLEAVWNYTFSSCKKLTAIDLPRSTKEVGICCFLDCIQLVSVDLRPTSVRKIGSSAFCGCTSLKEIHFSDTTEMIGSLAFRDCRNLTRIDFPASVREIDVGSFLMCSGLTSIYFQPESSLQIIGDRAFGMCSNLQNVNFATVDNKLEKGEGNDFVLERIGDIFGHCTSLPPSLEKVGRRAFGQCSKLFGSDFDADTIHFECDLNRGGRKFLARHVNNSRKESGKDRKDDLGSANNGGLLEEKEYPPSLWPLIIHRIVYDMEFPKYNFETYDHFSRNIRTYTSSAPIRRASVVYLLMVHGVAMDLASSS